MTGSRRGLFVAVALATVVPAVAGAGDLENWQKFHDVALVAAADGDLRSAEAGYEQLIHNLAADDPLRAETLYQLGELRYTLGDVDGARDALRDCARFPNPSREACLDLYGEIELDASSVTKLPVKWTFDDGESGFVHPTRFDEKRSIRIAPEAPGGAALEWRTYVDGREDDALIVGFRQPQPAPKGVRFRVRSTRFDERLRLVLYDVFDHRFIGTMDKSTTLTATAGAWTTVEIRFDQARGDERTPLDTSELDRLVLEDRTTPSASAQGENVLYIDDFEVF